jgi:hypothetical protein
LKSQIYAYSQITSESIKVRCAKTIVSVTSTTSLFFIFCIIFENITQAIQPNIIHQKNIDEKDNIQFEILENSILFQLSIIHKITRNIAIEVQSLNKLSHSKIVISLLGAQIDLKSDKTATVSVAEIKLQ